MRDPSGKAYRAYCIAPSFFSWLGNGTSRRGLPVTLSGGPCASCAGVTSVADFEDVDEIKADGPARKGRRAAVGLAGREDKLDTGGNVGSRKASYLAMLKRLRILW